MSDQTASSQPDSEQSLDGFASAERRDAAKAFLKAHASYGVLGDFVRQCAIAVDPAATAVRVEPKAEGKGHTLIIPGALESLTDESVGAHNALSAGIVQQAGRFLINSLTRTPRPSPIVSAAAPEDGDTITASELDQALKSEGLGDIAAKLSDRRSASAPQGPAPSAPSA